MEFHKLLVWEKAGFTCGFHLQAQRGQPWACPSHKGALTEHFLRSACSLGPNSCDISLCLAFMVPLVGDSDRLTREAI